MDIFEMLKNAGAEIPEDKKESFNTEFRKAYKSEAEVTKKLSAAEKERDGWKMRAETAEETLKGFEGKDFDEITKDRDAWKKKFEELEEEQNKAKQEAEMEAAINEHVSGLNFKDEYRKRAYIDDLKKEGYQVKDGKLIGASDFQKKYDADAFVDEKQQQLENNRAKFTTKTNQQTDGAIPTKEQIMAMKDPSERQKAIREHIDLFQKGE